MKKLVSLIIILLFIGVAIAPSIDASDDLVELDVEFCGLGRKHTIQLTQQEADEVEQLFVDIEQKLSEAETREEAEIIFKETVVELDRFGLLGGMSVEQAQSLVTGKEHNPVVVKLFEIFYKRNHEKIGNNTNILCLIAGITDYTWFIGPIMWSFLILLFKINSEVLYFILLSLFLSYSIFLTIFPMAFGYNIYVGNDDTHPAYGWLSTIGLNGKKSWNGPFIGNITRLKLIEWLEGLGVVGFTGIKIYFQPGQIGFYFGSALWVKIEEVD